MFLNNKLCIFQSDITDQTELFKVMSDKLVESGDVKETYLEGITTREASYPTGLEVDGIGFAIPHTDSAHVNSSQICFASLKNPIIFKDMTDLDKEIPVKLVFMLAMSQPHEQLETLQNLVGLFQDLEKVEQVLKCTTQEEFMKIMDAAGVK